MEWQARMEPTRFNKSRGAQYHTAPTVLPHDAPECPDGTPDEAIAFLFFIDSESWIGEPVKTEVAHPVFQEGKPQSKTAKNGPVFVLGEETALCAIPVKENYYWAANVLSKQKVLYVSFSPNKKRTDGKPRKIKVLATFVPKGE